MQIKQLHQASYSQLTDYYADLSEPMALLRRNILETVLLGQKQTAKLNTIGAFQVGEEVIPALPKNSNILDVGCANGDNLQIMRQLGFSQLAGIDIAPDMVAAAKERTQLPIHCGDFFEYAEPTADVVFAQALIHLFPKHELPQVLQRLLSLSKQRLYFSTTIHDQATEGLEPKVMQVVRYRSRYTKAELLNTIQHVMESANREKNTWRVFYFFLTDCLGKYWINVVFDKIDLSANYSQAGAMVYRNLIQADAITALGKTLEDFATQKAPTNTWLRYDDGPLFDRVENFIPFLNPDMREHLSSPVISNLLETCFGNPVVLLKDKCNFKPPGKSDFPLHQDAAAGWEKSGYGKKHITLAISLDDVSLDNGAVRFALGKHQEGLFSSLYEVMDPNYLQQWDFYPLAMSPGDAVIFDSYTPHYSTANLSQQSRKMLFLTYIDASYADLASQFFPEKRLRQPPMDERDDNTPLVRNEYGKWIRKTE